MKPVEQACIFILFFNSTRLNLLIKESEVNGVSIFVFIFLNAGF